MLARFGLSACALTVAVFGVPVASFAQDATKLFGRAKTSVVSIETATSAGTGFFVGDGSLLVTCAHVIEDDTTIRLKGTKSKISDLLFIDAENDVAILSVYPSNSTALSLSSSSPPSGTKIYAIGYSLGMFQNSISDGIVSGLRNVSGLQHIQFTAAVSPGNSGGPLLNSAGSVVGMVAGSFRRGQNVNLAIPVKAIQHSLVQAKKERSGIEARKKLVVYKPMHSRTSGEVVLGFLGKVISPTSIFAEQSRKSHSFSKAIVGQNITVKRTSSMNWLAVLLQNGKQAYVPSECISILDSEVIKRESGQVEVVSKGQQFSGGKVTQEIPSFPTGKSDRDDVVETLIKCAFSLLGRTAKSFEDDDNGSMSSAGLMHYVFKKCGFEMPLTSSGQSTIGSAITRFENLRAGDILNFWDGDSVTESGLFLGYYADGEARFITLLESAGIVGVEDLREPKWKNKLFGARRISDFGKLRIAPPRTDGPQRTHGAITASHVSEMERKRASDLADEAEKVLFDSKVVASMRYRKAYWMFKEVLRIDPNNSSAKSNIELIEDIYKTWGLPIPVAKDTEADKEQVNSNVPDFSSPLPGEEPPAPLPETGLPLTGVISVFQSVLKLDWPGVPYVFGLTGSSNLKEKSIITHIRRVDGNTYLAVKDWKEIEAIVAEWGYPIEVVVRGWSKERKVFVAITRTSKL